jgi:hypothetical protein
MRTLKNSAVSAFPRQEQETGRVRREPSPVSPVSPFLFFMCLCFLCETTFAAEELFFTDGSRLSGVLSVTAGRWALDGKSVDAGKVVWVRFSGAAEMPVMNEGVYLRRGTLLRGKLETYAMADGQGEAVVSASVLGDERRTLPAAEIAGAFFFVPDGSVNAAAVPFLNRRPAIVRGAFFRLSGGTDAAGFEIKPGSRAFCTLTYGEAIPAKLISLTASMAIMEMASGDVESPPRQKIRLVECLTPTPPHSAPPPEAGDEFWVRLTAGDLLRARLKRLDDESAVLWVAEFGDLRLPRIFLASLFPLGGQPNGSSGLIWLSDLKPQIVQTPFFDAEFPPKPDASCKGLAMRLDGVVCERGWGVHAQNELTFTVPTGMKALVFFAGLDDETGARGCVAASAVAGDKTLWSATKVDATVSPVFVSVPLAGINKISLKVDFGPDQDDAGDHFNWAWAAFVK